MEIQQVVVLSESGDLQLTNLSRHVLYHTLLTLVPEQGLTMVLPKSGSRKIEALCSELPKAILGNSRKRRKSGADKLIPNQLIPTIEIHKFLERATGVEEFVFLIEKNLLAISDGELDPDKLHMTCWNVYLMERQQEISIPQWFSPTCMYRLWLVFCCVQETSMGDVLPAATTNDVIRRLVELCGYNWNDADRYADTKVLTFHEYLKAIASYFTKLRLDMSLTCEVILDLLEEVVHGVLKKGYLVKKGHKMKNFKRRWFILQRNIMMYFDTRDNMNLKGQLVLNSRTEVKSVPDTRKRKYAFEVTCGKTGTPFEIYADDQKSKQQWMLAIKKAIALAKVLDGSSKEEDYSDMLTGFYLLKYGISQPNLSRQDSSVRKMKYYATFREQRKRLSGKENNKGKEELSEEVDVGTPPDEYMEMKPLNTDEDFFSDSSEEGSYTSMSPIREIRSTFSKSLDILDASPLQSRTGLGGTEQRHENGSKGRVNRLDSDPLEGREGPSGSTMDDNVYDNADFTPCYTPKTIDPQVGGYIDITLMKRKDTEVEMQKPRSSSMEGAEVDDVGFVTARTMSLDLLGSKRSAAPPPSYLTIIRGPDVGGGDTVPTVPTRAKSLSPDRTLGSSESESSHFEPSSSVPSSTPFSTSTPPLVASRSRREPSEVGPPVAPRDYSSPKHRKSEPIITVARSNTQGKTPPPLPPH